MEQRGRKSLASLSVVQPEGIVTIPRPQPPSILNEGQAAVWRQVVNAMDADWFRPETHPLLIQFCRITSRLDQLEEMYGQLGPETDIDALAKLDAMITKNTAVQHSLARGMRLTQQATYSARKSKGSVTITMPKPWESK